MKQTFKPKCANHKVSTKGCEICVWARKEEFKTNKFAKKIKEENKKCGHGIVHAYHCIECLRFKGDLPDSEQGVKDYKKWGDYNTAWQEGFDEGTVCGYESANRNYYIAIGASLVVGFVTAIILFNSAIINLVN